MGVLLALLLFCLALPAWGAGSIDVATIVTGEAADPTTTLTVEDVLVPGDAVGAQLAVCIGAIQLSDVTPVLDTVTWNGRALTEAVRRSVTIPATRSVVGALFVLRAPNLGVTSDLVVTFGDPFFTASGAAFVMEGLADAGAETNGSEEEDELATISTTVATSSADAFLVDCLSVFDPTTNAATTQGGQTERVEVDHGTTLGGIAVSDKQGPGSPGATTLSWGTLVAASSSQVQVVGAFELAADTAIRDLIQGPGIIPGLR